MFKGKEIELAITKLVIFGSGVSCSPSVESAKTTAGTSWLELFTPLALGGIAISIIFGAPALSDWYDRLRRRRPTI